MKRTFNILFATIALIACNKSKTIPAAEQIIRIPYPVTERGNQKDIYFGTVVADPYRWLEDDQSAKTSKWIAAQNKITSTFIRQIPYRGAMKERMKSLWNYEKFSAPFKEGNYIYFLKNNGLQNQWVIYRTKGEGSKEEIFLDPNTFSKDGSTALTDFSFSRDGSLMAYQFTEGGSDWTKVAVLRTADKSIVGDTLVNVKFTTLAWKGNEGIFYGTYKRDIKGNKFSEKTDQHQLQFHKINTPQSQDKLILGGASFPRRFITSKVSGDGRYLMITSANSSSGNELLIKDLSQPTSKFSTVVGNLSGNHEILDIVDDKIYIRTDLNAPNGRLVAAEISKPSSAYWKQIIPQTNEVLQATTAGGKIFAHYLKDALSSIRQYDLNGKFEHKIKLPDIGSVPTVGVNAKAGDKYLYYYFTSYINPGTIYKYNISSGRSERYKKPSIQFDPTDYISRQIFYTSKDGTRVPMIITHKKGIKLDGSNPTLLHGYGGFNISVTPTFDVRNVILLEQGGILAVANLRGGGEYGTKWHLAGTKMQKQNTFDDFIAAAEYLVREKYTSAQRLAIAGESNGGLLIGACMTQRPDLFKVAFPGVGVLDMLRFNKFTAGEGWIFDFGSPEESVEMFKYLYHYSPYHALKQNTAYPATLITTADHDDRVIPAHSFKFAARLQQFQKGKNPVLIRIDTLAGHGGATSTELTIEQQADKWAFMFHNMGLSYHLLK
ncbi:prolyl oligopeptidase family serine peptidase [Pedobacter petrophilus]|uniref:prolyl oligopeptidase n=2 Tax=Pedobacter TaxID=84567 RepID=A0A7K0G447_9SPHI|nr:prolyl oligopeptidase family serine peptidase [Pedobacter petrophilus]MRX78573.1 prolyl oligopeptidase family serine peptidase [Pedobacter petrophilus]